jgi:hypothetical protein
MNGLGEAISETHLRMGKTRELSTELLDQELSPYDSFLVRGCNEDQGKMRSLLIPW